MPSGRGTKRARLTATQLPKEKVARLEKLLRPHDKGDPEKADHPEQIKFAAIMDVGQGSCNVLFDNNDLPKVYIDIGSSGNGSSPSRLFEHGPCLSNPEQTIIVLSHWHRDHYKLATYPLDERKGNLVAKRSKESLWIVPDQKLVFQSRNLFESLTNVIVLRNDPQSSDSIGYAYKDLPWGSIVTCSGSDRNNGGLAVYAKIKTDPSEVVRLPQYTLFTGDASCGFIPNHDGLKNHLTGLTAPHHGAHTHHATENIPRPAHGAVGKVAFSYGISDWGPPIKRHYGHPSDQSIAAIRDAGWEKMYSTAENGPRSNVQGRGNIKFDEDLPANPNAVYVHDSDHCTFQSFKN